MGVASGRRACKSCGHLRLLDDYSAEQWVKDCGAAICSGCIANADSPTAGATLDTSLDIQAVDKAMELVRAFNKA